MKIVAKAVIVLIALLGAAGLVGTVTGSNQVSALPGSGMALLPLALWFALGSLSGFGAFGIAGAWASPDRKGDWTRRPAAFAIANRVVASDFATIFVLAVLSRFFHLGLGLGGRHLVPDSAPHTLLFLAAAAFAIAIARVTTLPKPGDAEGW